MFQLTTNFFIKLLFYFFIISKYYYTNEQEELESIKDFFYYYYFADSHNLKYSYQSINNLLCIQLMPYFINNYPKSKYIIMNSRGEKDLYILNFYFIKYISKKLKKNPSFFNNNEEFQKLFYFFKETIEEYILYNNYLQQKSNEQLEKLLQLKFLDHKQWFIIVEIFFYNFFLILNSYEYMIFLYIPQTAPIEILPQYSQLFNLLKINYEINNNSYFYFKPLTNLEETLNAIENNSENILIKNHYDYNNMSKVYHQFLQYKKLTFTILNEIIHSKKSFFFNEIMTINSILNHKIITAQQWELCFLKLDLLFSHINQLIKIIIFTTNKLLTYYLTNPFSYEKLTTIIHKNSYGVFEKQLLLIIQQLLDKILEDLFHLQEFFIKIIIKFNNCLNHENLKQSYEYLLFKRFLSNIETIFLIDCSQNLITSIFNISINNKYNMEQLLTEILSKHIIIKTDPQENFLCKFIKNNLKIYNLIKNII